MKLLNIGFVGNMPQPFGGVATFCYQLTSKLLADGHNVSFYDRYPHLHKSRPLELTRYLVAPKGKSISSVSVFARVLMKALFDRKLRILINNLLVGLYQVGLPKISIKLMVLVFLRVFDMWHFFKDKKVDVFHGQHANACDCGCLCWQNIISSVLV